MNETKEIYEKNLGLLTEWLKNSVQQIDEHELWRRIEVKYNEEGYPVCLYHRNGKCFHITSEKPVEEARHWWESIPDTIGSGAIFLYGSGFGYPIFEVFSQKKAHTLVVVFEEDIFLFKAMLYYFDFQPVIKSGKIVFLIGDPEYYAQAFEQLFFSVFFISCTYPIVAHTYAAQRNFKEQYIEIHKDVFAKLSMLVFYMGNDHKDNLIGFKNIMANVKPIMENANVSCLKDKYKGFPAFVIANGPSLDQNIHKLKDIQGRGLILCVESASIPMLKNDINPDILVVIERIKSSYTYHFRDIKYPGDVALLSLALADPRIFASFSGEKIPVFRDKEIVNLWISEHLGDGSVIDAGANVSHLAAELAIYMGANPIIFVGQDYAYGPNRDTHSKNSIYSQEKGQKAREIIQSRPLILTEGNDGQMVSSNELWLDLKKGLEMKIAAHSQSTFINATEGGARIIGTTCEKLDEAIRKYCVNPLGCRVNEWISDNRANISISSRKSGLEKLMESTRHYAKEFRDTALEVSKAKLECKNILRMLPENETQLYNRILEDAYQKNIGIFNRLIMNGMFRCFLQQVVFSNYYLINCLKMIDTPEKTSEIFRIHCSFLNQIGIVCQSVSIHFENALALLTNEIEHIYDIESGEGNELS